MVWQGIHQHDHVVEKFRGDVRRGRLASTFLFVGPPGVGKRTMARALGKGMLCETNSPDSLDPCGQCAACIQVDAATHPDLLLAGLPPGKNIIPVGMMIGPLEKRNQEGLCHDFSLKPMRGGRKVAIIDDADHFNQESGNCLLKMLEEPPPLSVIFLIASRQERVLSTIQSRSQIIRFSPLSRKTVTELLIEHQLVEDPDAADHLADLTGGSLRRAVELADPDLLPFRQQMYGFLSATDIDSAQCASSLQAFVDAAGKEAPPRRTRLKIVLDFAIDFYRQVMRGLVEMHIEGDRVLRDNVTRACRSWPGTQETAAACIERTVDASAQVDANANLATLVYNWTEDIGDLVREGKADPPEIPILF